MNRSIPSIVIVLLLTAMPLAVGAQTHLNKAFAEFAQSKAAYISKDFKLTKDPETGKKTDQYTIYRFEMPLSEKKSLNMLLNAFERDNDEAYSVVSGDMRSQNSGQSDIALAIGDGFGASVYLEAQNSQYIYSLFLDPDDQEKKYRYAYAMAWRTENKKIIGKLVMTYAVRLEKRSFSSFLSTAAVASNKANVSSVSSHTGPSAIAPDGTYYSSPATMYSFSPFQKIIVNTAANIRIEQNKTNKHNACVYTHKGSDSFKFIHSPGELTVMPGDNQANADPSAYIVISVPQIKEIINNSSGQMTIDGAVTQRLAILNNGSANIRANDLTASNIDVYNNGTGNIQLDGVANNARLSLTSSAIINAKALKASNVSIACTGSGLLQCYADVSLNGTGSGNCTFEYHGNPRNVSLDADDHVTIVNVSRDGKRTVIHDGYQKKTNKKKNPKATSQTRPLDQEETDIEIQAEEAWREAQKEAEKARQEAQKEAEKARQEALKEAEKARQEALKEAEKARQEALKEAKKARAAQRRDQ